MRKENEELKSGSIKPVDSDYNVLVYGRFNRENQCVIAINNNHHPVTRELSVWELGTPKNGKMKVILQSSNSGYILEGAEYDIYTGKITIELPPTSGTILKYVEE